MDDLLWFQGIHWDTPLRDIGWTYMFGLGLGSLLVWQVKKMIREIKGDDVE